MSEKITIHCEKCGADLTVDGYIKEVREIEVAALTPFKELGEQFRNLSVDEFNDIRDESGEIVYINHKDWCKLLRVYLKALARGDA